MIKKVNEKSVVPAEKPHKIAKFPDDALSHNFSRGVLIFSLNRTQILENSKRSKTAKILGIKQGPILCGQTRQETFGYTRSKKGVR